MTPQGRGRQAWAMGSPARPRTHEALLSIWWAELGGVGGGKEGLCLNRTASIVSKMDSSNTRALSLVGQGLFLWHAAAPFPKRTHRQPGANVTSALSCPPGLSWDPSPPSTQSPNRAPRQSWGSTHTPSCSQPQAGAEGWCVEASHVLP